MKFRRPTHPFGRYYSPNTGRAYLCAQPSRKSVKRIIGKIREATERRVLWLDAETMVTRLNRVLVGWANYYSLGPVHTAYRTIDRYTPLRLRRWLCNKHKIANTGTRCFPYVCSSMTRWVSCNCDPLLTVSRVRRPDVLSESRMP